MFSNNFLYRATQKLRYHAAGSWFGKRVAEINKYEKLIHVRGSGFTIKGCDVHFNTAKHSFILQNFSWVEQLLKSHGRFIVENSNLYFNISGLTLRLTTAEELFIVTEIFLDKTYRVATSFSYSVIDVGMNVGMASLFFAAQPMVHRVIGYEPFVPTFLDAQSNFNLNPSLLHKIEPNNFGLSSRDEVLSVAYSQNQKGKNSIYTTLSGSEKIELKEAVIVFGEIMERHPEERFLVKVDCEGAEFSIFESLQSCPIHSNIFGFIIEWHQRDPQPIVEVLTTNGFKVQVNGYTSIGLITAFR